jgi:hypothetical protein
MKTTIIVRLLVGAILWVCVRQDLYAASPTPATLEWIRQYGGTEAETIFGVSADGLGNIYSAGYVLGQGLVLKYDAAGSISWSRLLGTTPLLTHHSVSADQLGGVYLTGFTLASLGTGDWDAYVSKYDNTGNLQWHRQLGTAVEDRGWDAATDGLGNVYITGFTYGNLGSASRGNTDAFVAKYDATGTRLWIRQFGTGGFDSGSGVATDRLGNVYVTGITTGVLSGSNAGVEDIFLRKYNSDGTDLWTRQLGTVDTDNAADVSADSFGNIYISGYTRGNLGGPNAGESDAFISKYNSAGSLLWTRQFGTAAEDESFGVSAIDADNVYVTGFTAGSLAGTNPGGRDAFLTKYDAAGTNLWMQQLGTTLRDSSSGVSADGLGNVYIAGDTQGSLGGPRAGQTDAFLAKYHEQIVAEPSSFGIVCLCGFITLATSRRCRATNAGRLVTSVGLF